MKFRRINYLLLMLVSPFVVANEPPQPAGFGFFPALSGEVGEFISFDLSDRFSDPDGDDLTFHLADINPLAPGLSLNSETGVVSGVLGDLGAEISVGMYFYAEDPSGATSGVRGQWIWTPFRFGTVADVFVRMCDPGLFDCVPGYNYNVPRTSVFDADTAGDNVAAVYPVPPTAEATRASLSVGYESAELTPAISAFLRPGDERMTANPVGVSRHLQTGDVTIEATLTYSQTGGILGPDLASAGDNLAYAAISDVASALFTFRLLPEANGALDGSLCSDAGGIRDLIFCIRSGSHPHVIDFQESLFPLPFAGNEGPGDNTLTPSVTEGAAFTSVHVPYPGVDTDLYIGAQIFLLARHGGEVDMQNTLVVDFDDPAAMAPNMPEVTAPTFQPAPESGGVIEASVNAGDCITINGHGRIPIVVFGSPEFAAAEVDFSSVRFGDFPLATRGKGKPACSIADVDLDGEDDVTCQFLDNGAPLEGAPGQVLLSAELATGPETYYGTTEVCLY